MANAAIVIDNNADNGTVTASTQELTMPVANLLTPHPSERWRSLTNADYFILDKGSLISADTVGIFGLTGGATSTIRVRLSTVDATGAAGDVFDSGVTSNGSVTFDVNYGSFVGRLSSPAAYRYVRVDISDPAATFVEAGCVLDGLAEAFTYNFAPGGSFQHVDRSRISQTSSGKTLTWQDNTFRRLDLSFGSVTSAQRYGVIERLDLVKGRKRNVLLMTDTAGGNLPRDSIFGLVTDQTPVSFSGALDVLGNPLFGKQFRMDERI